MSDTLGSMRAEVLLELRGDLAQPEDVPLLSAKINNAIESIWMAMMKVALARFFGSDSPVNFTLASGAQRVQLVSIADPTAALANVVNVAGGALAARNYQLFYTFVTESGAETNPSPVLAFAATQNNLAQIPPPAEPAGGAFGWNLYAGVNNPALQNQQPLPFGVNYTEPVTGFQDYPTNQQLPPTSNKTADNISYITHLEIVQTDTTIRSLNQADLDSLAMRGLARTLASASEYQMYAWDLINGRVLEVRPPTGTAFSASALPTPRYFYVAKPRRLRYDQAEIPYTEIAGVHEYITNKTLADLKLILDEYLSAQGYTQAAAAQKQEVVSALSQENWAKNTRITPFLY